MTTTPPPCDYIAGSNNPCATCPRKITSLHMCGLLQEAASDEEDLHQTKIDATIE